MVYQHVLRFLKYSSIGVSTFLLDLFLLYIFTDIAGIHYLVSTALAFVIAVSLNYFFSRTLVFAGTTRPLGEGYVIFIAIAGVGLILATSMMYVLVSVLGVYYITSRVIVAGIVGIWNYVMNASVNFRTRV